MRLNSLFAALTLAFVPAMAMGSEEVLGQDCDAPPTFIQSVRVFDGAAVISAATVVLHCERIDQLIVGDVDVQAPDGAVIVDGSGKTLLPGIIDSHSHNFSRTSLERNLRFGVTTVLDMGSASRDFKRTMDAEDDVAQTTDRADIYGAQLWVTAPDSHGTQFGPVPTLDAPEKAEAFVVERLELGADFIKVIYDRFKMIPRPVPTLSKETMNAVVDAAHRHGVMAVFHARDVESVREATEAGADGFVHVVVDQVPDQDLIDLMKEKGVFVSPDLSLMRPDGMRLISDPVLGPLLTEDERKNLEDFYPGHNEGGDDVHYASLKAFYESGIPILLGTDYPNGGTSAGVSMHLELELAVEAGMSTVDALAAATSVPAKTFGLSDRGRIEPGLLADLILVEGRPDEKITDTRNIVTIWKAGKSQD